MPRLNPIEILVQHPDGKPFGRRLVRFAERALKELGLRGYELSICLATDSYVRSLNRRWRRRNTPTDVLSFPAAPSPIERSGATLLGDVVVSLDTARSRARRGKEGLERELERYLAHGLLHLLGYDHHRRAKAVEMASLERRLLGGKGMVPAPPRKAAIPRKGRARVGIGG